MRPLEHLGTGAGSADYELYIVDEQIYDKLSERGEHLLEQLYKEYMSDFSEPPKKSLKELNEELTERQKRARRLKELRAPDVIIEYEELLIDEIETSIANKNFLSHNDKEGIIYKKLYEQKEILFYSSDERKKLLQEIYKYNEECAKELGIDLTSLDDTINSIEDTFEWE